MKWNEKRALIFEKRMKRYENYCKIGYNMKIEERYQD